MRARASSAGCEEENTLRAAGNESESIERERTRKRKNVVKDIRDLVALFRPTFLVICGLGRLQIKQNRRRATAMLPDICCRDYPIFPRMDSVGHLFSSSFSSSFSSLVKRDRAPINCRARNVRISDKLKSLRGIVLAKPRFLRSRETRTRYIVDRDY